MMAKYLPFCILTFALLVCSLNSYSQNNKMTSRKTVFFRVTAPDGSWVRACVYEGGMLKIKDISTGMQAAFLPIINNSDENITMEVYQIINTSSGENLVQVESQPMGLQSSIS